MHMTSHGCRGSGGDSGPAEAAGSHFCSIVPQLLLENHTLQGLNASIMLHPHCLNNIHAACADVTLTAHLTWFSSDCVGRGCCREWDALFPSSITKALSRQSCCSQPRATCQLGSARDHQHTNTSLRVTQEAPVATVTALEAVVPTTLLRTKVRGQKADQC